MREAIGIFCAWGSFYKVDNLGIDTTSGNRNCSYNALIEHVISIFGVPKEIYTDMGRNFESKLFKELCKLLGIQKSHTVPYHTQANGFIEVFNKFLTHTLRLCS